jgi:hypothetical protein
MGTRTPLEVRFWSKVEKSDGCWVWTGLKDHWGYGKIGVSIAPDRSGQRMERAHRVSFRLAHGRDPDPDLFVCHRCDNPSCVRPDHLYEGTHEQNMADMIDRGRETSGTRNAQAKLTTEQVQEIRRRRDAGDRIQKVADDFGVSISQVSRIHHGQRRVKR